jgi:modulator of FtsH protease
VLVPQSTDALAVELLATGVILGVLLVGSALRSRGPRDVTGTGIAGQVGVEVLGTVPFAVAGITLLINSGGGLYWALGGVIAATVGAVLNAWVLLVEILR